MGQIHGWQTISADEHSIDSRLELFKPKQGRVGKLIYTDLSGLVVKTFGCLIKRILAYCHIPNICESKVDFLLPDAISRPPEKRVIGSENVKGSVVCRSVALSINTEDGLSSCEALPVLLIFPEAVWAGRYQFYSSAQGCKLQKCFIECFGVSNDTGLNAFVQPGTPIRSAAPSNAFRAVPLVYILLFKAEQSYYFEDASPASFSVSTIEIKNKSDFQNIRSKSNLFSKLYWLFDVLWL